MDIKKCDIGMASDSESEDDFDSSSDNGEDDEVDESLMEVTADLEDDLMESMSQWQKDIWHQKYLPYFEQTEKEADEQFKIIKAGLAHSIIHRDVRPALLHWICELDKYINLYSRRFSKTDHIALVNLMYECMVMKGLEYRMVKVCSHSLSNLLAKKELLSREDLTIQWRPLYDIYVEVTCKNLEEDGMLLLPDGLKVSLETVIGHSRVYFPLEATREILDEVRPYMCPWDESMLRALNMLNLFLPTCLSHEQHEKYGAKLWFDEMWHWFTAVENSAPWETKVGLILARLTRESPGYIDWTDKYDTICTRLLRAFDLDIGQEQIPVGTGAGVFSLDAAASWFCYMLGGPDDGIQGHLTRLFRSLESYFHPSNYGHHTANLLTFVLKLVQSICTRLNRERYRKPNSHPLVPPAMRLTNRQVDLFVESVLPSTLLTVFSKYKQEFAPGIVRFLGLLAPRMVVPAVLDTVYPALETLTEPHRLLQSMNCLVAVCVSLVRDADNDPNHQRRALQYAEDQSGRPCRSHVISLLNAVLPGLDANDIGKSMVTFQTIGLLCALVPIVDCSEAVHVRDDLTEEERELCSATSNFEGIVELLMTRMFALIETCAHGQSMTTVQSSLTAKAQAKFSFEENLMKNGIFSVFRTLVGNCSTPIYKVAVDRLFDFVNENMFDSRIAADTLAEMIFCAVRTNPAESLPRFLNLIMKRLRAAVSEDTHTEEEVDSAVIWYIVLASQLVRVSGAQIVRFRAEILELLSLVMPLKCRQAHDIACTLLENVLIVLTTHYVDMHEFNRRKLDQPFEKFLPIRHWARTVDRKSWELKWHVPTEEELSLVDEIFRLFLTPELDRLTRPNDMTKEEVLKSLLTIKAAIAGSSALLPMFETEAIPLIDSAVDMHPFSYTIAAPTVRNLTLGNKEHARQKILNVLRGLVDFSLNNREDDTKSMAAICKVYQLLLFHRGLDKLKYDKQLQGFNMSKRIVGDAVRGNRANIEAITQEFVVLQHHKRLLTRSGYYFTKSHLDIMRDMVRVGTSMYSVVRVEAQKTLDACVQSFPYSYKHILDDVLLLLKEDLTISHEQFKGALYILLNGKKLCICVRQTWETLLKVWPAVVTAQHSEKPSVIALLELAQNTVVDNLESFQIRFEFSESCVQMAKKI
uniref:Proteasome activator Blm10 mid region domain-containing protein n=1 Tax=Plectus sambesii TaxID=2011161 RepID=A0A914WJL6_9BILA